jgi:hypothetical protein
MYASKNVKKIKKKKRNKQRKVGEVENNISKVLGLALGEGILVSTACLVG